MYETFVLDNGLRVLMVPVPGIQSVSAGVFVAVGSRYESDELGGASHFIEHMLFKGTARWPTARLLAEAIEGVGGLSNAYTDQELTVYYAKVAAAQAATAIEVLVDMARYPLFDEAEIEKERAVIGEELNMVYDAPDEWLEVLVDQLLWPNHPLGRNVAGTEQSLTGLNRSRLTSFYQQHYHPQNLLIALAGAVEPDTLLPMLTDLLADWQPADSPTFPAAPASQNITAWHIENRSIEQGHLGLALPGLPRTHPNRYALNLLNAVLGDGMSSRLFQTIREEKGLAYAVDSSLTMLHDTGSLVIYAGVDPDRAVETVQTIQQELDRLCQEPISEAELRKTKEYVKGRLILGLEDSYSQAAWVAYQAIFKDSIKTPQDVLEAYEAVTATDLQVIAQQIFRPDYQKLAAVGPFGRGEDLIRLTG